ncbi:hypothetical protein IQ272_11580 [Chroococcidiopsidales cyanobacterium LEGE 13417]|uniref:hypothetical protein n=1 Tax=Chroococcidiopsis sp. CCALA 051 TaxID=869949 RepID=UPI0018EBD209|nr:hypothetical protein [Chroococcidiopsis sp. CCALA 051]MBE9016766.1 hypothetical protein [Chroococcidiopsidales cyanobacterium LEGE 13417]
MKYDALCHDDFFSLVPPIPLVVRVTKRRVQRYALILGSNPKYSADRLTDRAMNNPFCSYNIIASDTNNLPPYSEKLQEYWMAGNGIFLRSHRPELEVCLAIAHCIVGHLPHIQPYFRLVPPKVAASSISEIIRICLEAGDREVLFYLSYDDRWQLHVPPQTASRTSVAAMESSFNSNTVHLRLRCAEDKENRRIGSGGGASMSWFF